MPDEPRTPAQRVLLAAAQAVAGGRHAVSRVDAVIAAEVIDTLAKSNEFASLILDRVDSARPVTLQLSTVLADVADADVDRWVY